MNIFRIMFRFLRWRPWMRIPAIILGILCVIVAIWIGFPMTGIEIMSTVWLRATLIGLIVGLILLFQILGWRKRRAAAREIEEALTPPEPTGDGTVLAERMNDALSTLKKSGGASYLYDLPWYVIIGPPGAGKTTALRNSGIEFPLSNADDAGVVSGFGGTRYCDWWFAEDAILIDTAGRYTTQDSDKTADESSWQSFLDLLKKSRPKQPINGVILAFSVEDMMNATPEQLTQHSEIVRTRLGEVHEKLRIDFPVYVLFTKCDLISGFREYFSSFSLNRRKAAWGVTFQTKDRKTETHEQVPAEFDQLVSRLSDELIDRLTEEPDGISRVAIFGLPGQMALLRDNVSDFLRRIFEPTRYKSSAILRGFYFTSGTQEGTPIDQVLGAMSRNDQAPGAFAPSFMSGQGKSFFLHDVLRRVIFEERDWVGHDARAVRRARILRILGLSTIGLGTAALLAGLGLSFWQNKSYVDTVEQQAFEYANAAQTELNRTEVDNSDVVAVLPYLDQMQDVTLNNGAIVEETTWNGFGLRQLARINTAGEASYGDALEQMLRPRLILDLEQRLPNLRDQGDPAEIYRALKVYMLLAGLGPRPDDDAIKAWFGPIWDETYAGLGNQATGDALKLHLANMLELDDTKNIAIPVDDAAITLSRSAIVQMSLVDQAYAIIQDKARQSALPDFNLADELHPEGPIVFATNDGSDFAELSVPALYTFDGYWFFFLDQVLEVGDVLENDKWVLGDQANAVNYDNQLAGLEQALQLQYARDFETEWMDMLDRVQVNNMAGDAPNYTALGTASSQFASPIVRLANAVVRETKMTSFLDELESLDPTAMASGDIGADVGGQMFQRFKQTSGGLQRILLEAASNSAKNQQRVGGGQEGPRREAERIEDRFELWHRAVEQSAAGRPIDVILATMEQIQQNRRLAVQAPGGVEGQLLPGLLNDLTRYNSNLPGPIGRYLNDVKSDFEAEATDADIGEMNREMGNTVAFECRQSVDGYYPFDLSSARHVSVQDFSRFFGPGGTMQTYYDTYLSRHVDKTNDGFRVRTGSPLAGRLSTNMLLQFERADKIQRAFFPSGERQPEVAITFSPYEVPGDLVNVTISVNDQKLELIKDGTSQSITWPGTGNIVEMNTDSRFETSVRPRQWTGGQWAIVDFIRSGQTPRDLGNGVRMTHIFAGRTVRFDMTFASNFNPFTMPELSNFSCPQSVD